MDNLQKQLQWHHEKARVALTKVQDRFQTPVDVEKFKLLSFKEPNKSYITTFRTCKITEVFEENLRFVK